MGIGDMINQAKSAIGGDAAVDAKIDEAAEAVKGQTPDQADGLVDQAAQVAKDQI